MRQQNSVQNLSGNDERGFALISSLMFLVVLTILAVSAMGTNSLEEKMLGFSRSWQIALQAADAALRDAERYLLNNGITGTTGFAANCSSGGGLYQVRTTGEPVWMALENDANCQDDAWIGKTSAINAASGKSFKYGSETGADPFKLDSTRDVASQPRYIIEVISVAATGTGSRKIGFAPTSTKYIYRVSAVGFGQRLTTRVLLQAIYRM